MSLGLLTSVLSTCFVFLIWRVSYVVLGRKSKPRRRSDCSRLAVFLGSGGHTSEAMTLLSALDFNRYSPRTYIISEGDILSARKAIALELSKAADSVFHSGKTKPYTILTIPRARRVHQPLYTTPVTAAQSLLTCLYHVTMVPIATRTPFADVLVLNGPGTCFVLCLAVAINRIIGLPSPRLIYVESFARVRSLSLSGKLMRPLVDR
ncbi:glycosyltransferase family 1 protein [Fomitopsis betulina]|nr:glycosyltransferase family 1 protein [Fomitopsis betulina]